MSRTPFFPSPPRSVRRENAEIRSRPSAPFSSEWRIKPRRWRPSFFFLSRRRDYRHPAAAAKMPPSFFSPCFGNESRRPCALLSAIRGAGKKAAMSRRLQDRSPLSSLNKSILEEVARCLAVKVPFFFLGRPMQSNEEYLKQDFTAESSALPHVLLHTDVRGRVEAPGLPPFFLKAARTAIEHVRRAISYVLFGNFSSRDFSSCESVPLFPSSR